MQFLIERIVVSTNEMPVHVHTAVASETWHCMWCAPRIDKRRTIIEEALA